MSEHGEAETGRGYPGTTHYSVYGDEERQSPSLACFGERERGEGDQSPVTNMLGVGSWNNLEGRKGKFRSFAIHIGQTQTGQSSHILGSFSKGEREKDVVPTR